MGMAASQARLLTITARIHDVEYQAQSIQNHKMQLARMSDDAMQEYLEILDGQELTLSTTGSGYQVQTIMVNFNSLMGENRLMGSSGQQYAIRNENGALVVSDNIYQAYQDFKDSSITKTADGFATMMMLGGEEVEDKKVNDELNNPETVDREDSTYQYYAQMFRLIQYAKDCVSIDSYDDFGNGDAENNSEFLDSMLRSKGWSIEIIHDNKKTGEITLQGTSASSDSSLSNTSTKEIDKTALAKAEANYEHTLKQIDAKDKQYDLELSKLETERNALTTQYDSVKKVIEDNIERTFGIFS